MEVTKIVITGGPCAGKSTAMSRIQEVFNQKGYRTIFIQETATELILAGINPVSCASNSDFQNCLLKLQVEKEKIYEEAVKKMDADKVLIVCDRGALDNRAYMTEEEFQRALESIHSNEIELRDTYDAVFHLVSAAKGAKDFYTKANNEARMESPEMAAAIDDKLIAAWTGHPHFRIIDNSTDFEEKIMRLITEISLFLGEPEPMEIERKYLIEYPDIEWLKKQENCCRVDIVQTYLSTVGNEEHRVRQRGTDGNYVYYETIKRKVDDFKRIEIERRLTKDQYLRLLMEADIEKHPIRKSRYCLVYENQYFEIDIYPFWDDKAIVEIELNSADEQVNFPKELKVIKEVTEDGSYKNASLATNHKM
ncbi:MAG: AAA family ATPase [Lachnospiraceae bacterium]|nr:AAA family ATPase [Lachnospiraceae bacterium]